jgi:hypothetical protein
MFPVHSRTSTGTEIVTVESKSTEVAMAEFASKAFVMVGVESTVAELQSEELSSEGAG